MGADDAPQTPRGATDTHTSSAPHTPRPLVTSRMPPRASVFAGSLAEKYKDGRLIVPEECAEIEKALKNVSTVNALADVFEALIGAVYLDSQGCLDTVLTLIRFIGMAI